MSAFAPPRHLVHWIVLAIVVVLVAVAVAFAIHVYSLLQPQRFTTLLEGDLSAAGLDLRLQAPAEPTLFPRPAVKLQGFSLTTVGSQTPVLRASGATIVVPWRALLHGEVAIERVDVDAPRIDLGQLESLLARLPHRAGPPRLPTITTGVHMTQGMLTRNGTPLLFDFGVETGALAPGQPFRLDLSARSASGRRIAATMSTVPSTSRQGAIAFDPLHFAITERQGMALELDGSGSWRGGDGFAMHLQGTLRHRRLAPPSSGAVPAHAATRIATPAQGGQTVTDRIALDLSPAAGAAPMTVALRLDGEDAHADLHLQPTEFARWWKSVLASGSGHPPAALPFTGSATVQQLDVGSLKAKGLSIDAGPDVPPASGASAATPAAAASR